MAYDPDNIFARIIRGEAPCVRVFEDEHTLAFMALRCTSSTETNTCHICSGVIQKQI